MIALISALLGFASSAMPQMLALFRDSKDRAHELALLKLQMDYEREKLGVAAEDHRLAEATQLRAIELQADSAEQAAIGARVKESLTGVAWVDALAGSVRPTLTYAFFVLYVAVKLAQLHVLMTPGLPWQQGLTLAQALVSLWTAEDTAMFSAIMAFWFGQRALLKARGA